MSGPFVVAEREGDVVWLTLNRPERLNAIHLEMRDELWMQLELLRDDPSVRAAVFRGAGDHAFSAGADISEFGTAPSYVEARDARVRRDLWGLMASLDLPLNRGDPRLRLRRRPRTLALLRPARRLRGRPLRDPGGHARLHPSAGGTQTVPRHVASSEALRMATSGEPISAREAYDLGFVQRVVPREQLDTAAREWAQTLAARDPAALRAAKRAVRDGLDRSLEDGLALERRLAAAVAAA